MANTISNISLANTFGDWVSTTVQTVNELNYIGNADWHKDSGTLYLDSNGISLDVANNSVFRGSVSVAGINSSLNVQKNGTVQGVLYLTNTDTDANPNKLILSANGVSDFNYLNVTGAGQSANVSNNMFIGGTLSITGNTTSSANLVVAKDITANNQTISYDLNVGEDLTAGRNLSVGNELNVTNDSNLNKTFTTDLISSASALVNNLTSNTNITGVTINSSGTSYLNEVKSNTAVTSPIVYASANLQAQVITSNTNLVVTNVTTTDSIQVNTVANTRTLSVTGTSFTDTLQANTLVDTPLVNVSSLISNSVQANTAANVRTLSVTQTASVDYLQANTAANTRTLSVTGTTFTDGLQANTAANTRTLSVTGTASINTLQANTLVNSPTVNTSVLASNTLTVGSNALLNNITSNTNISANSGTIWSSMISAPNIRFNTSLLGEGGVAGSSAITAGSGAFGTISVQGNFTINGQTVYNSDVFTLNATQTSNAFAYFSNYRPNGSNAHIRWNETSKWWDLRDVENPTFYNRILTANDFVSINTSIISANTNLKNYVDVADAGVRATITSNVSTLQTTITNNAVSANAVIVKANTDLKNYVDVSDAAVRATITSNTVTLQTNIDNNAISANAVIVKANTDLKNYTDSSFVKLTGTSQTIGGDISVTGNLSVLGTTTTIDTQSLVVEDSLIKLAKDNTVSDSVDIGFYGPYQTGGLTRYTGLFRKASDKFYLVQAVTTDPTANAITQFGTGYRATLDGNFTGGTVSGLSSPISISDGGSGTSTSTGTGSLVLSASPSFTGLPTAPTPPATTSNTIIATTAFVTTAVTTANSAMKTYVDGVDSTLQTQITNNAVSANDVIVKANTDLKSYVDNSKVSSVSGTSGAIVVTGTLTPVANLATTTVTPGTYGGTTNIPVMTFDSFGRAISAANVSITAGASLSDDTATNTTQYLTMSRSLTGTYVTAYVASTQLFFNPSTGTLTSTNYNSLSDSNYKQNIITISNATETIKQLNGVSFEWKNNGQKSFGIIAQEIEKILPELVDEVDSVKTVNYLGIIGFLINSVKELDARIQKLENKP